MSHQSGRGRFTGDRVMATTDESLGCFRDETPPEMQLLGWVCFLGF
ncbi:MAG: hypothetical protein ACK58L_00170 [Planctomycetota bacterium]